MNKIDLSNRVAIVTGGVQGFGLAIVKRFLQSGAEVIIWDKDKKLLEELKLDHNVHKIVTDVTDYQSVEKSTKESISKCGKIDILVNNAGIAGPSFKTWEYPLKDWQEVIDIDLNGVFYCCKSIVPSMIENNYGRIVNIASIAGRRGSPDLPHYSTTKAAVISWTQSSALQLAEFGINVNAICPGLLWTPMWEAIARRRTLSSKTSLGEQAGRDFFEKVVQDTIPMKREQTPEDIGNLCAFLVSDLAHNITGQAINVDGGRFSN